MNKKLRTLSLLLVLVMAFGLFAGCSKEEQQPADGGDKPAAGDDEKKDAVLPPAAPSRTASSSPPPTKPRLFLPLSTTPWPALT